MELYIHTPFCVRKCAYCDFLSFAGKEACMVRYGEALIRDVRNRGGILPQSGDVSLSSVYIGGGTPSLMPEGFYVKLFGEIWKNNSLTPDAEITIECNPGTVTPARLSEYRRAGINRISFGMQSADDGELKLLGRIHTWKDCVETVRMSREAGFDNVSIDLMMNLPGQTKEQFSETIAKALELKPEHISAYSLIIEEGTPFYGRYADHPELLPDEDAAAETYENAVRLLAEAGYGQYEISNFAKPGRECRHNIGYWRRAEYLGIGIGAASLIGDRRYRVMPDLENYLVELSYEPTETLTKRDIRNETVMLGLRMNDGVSISELSEAFGSEYAAGIARKMDAFATQGLARKDGDRYGLTVHGMLVSNAVIAELLEE